MGVVKWGATLGTDSFVGELNMVSLCLPLLLLFYVLEIELFGIDIDNDQIHCVRSILCREMCHGTSRV